MLIRKQTIIFVIRQIKLFLNREKYKELNESNNIQAYNIDDRMDGALRRLNNIPSDMFEIETKYHPDFILRRREFGIIILCNKPTFINDVNIE